MMVYRGMTGVAPTDLQRFVRAELDPQGGVQQVRKRVPAGQHRWWSTKPGIALTYATTAGVSGRPHVGSFDVVMVGESPGAQPSGQIGQVDRKDGQLVTVTTVAYVPSQGPSDQRRERLIALLDPTSAPATAREGRSPSPWAVLESLVWGR